MTLDQAKRLHNAAIGDTIRHETDELWSVLSEDFDKIVSEESDEQAATLVENLWGHDRESASVLAKKIRQTWEKEAK